MEPTAATRTWVAVVVSIFIIVSVVVFMSTKSSMSSINKNIMAFKSSSSTTEYSKLSSTEKKKLFEEFTKKYNKVYDASEEESRYSTFESNLKVIDERNKAEQKKGGNAVHGVTIFADIDEDELLSSKMGFLEATKKNIIKMAKNGDEKTFDSVEDSEDIVDWSGVYTTKIKDQGYCGSCWAFSSVSQIESDSIRAGYLTTDDELSEQQLVSCDTYDAACNGGNPYYAYYYVYKAGGIETNTSYPYASWGANVPSCESDSSKYVVTVNDFYYLSSEDAMESHVYSKGPLSVCVDATNWPTYESGVITDCGNEVNHCVQAVGINTKENYWIIRNSWGSDWGDNGYIYLQAGENMCDITYLPTYVAVSKVSKKSKKGTK